MKEERESKVGEMKLREKVFHQKGGNRLGFKFSFPLVLTGQRLR